MELNWIIYNLVYRGSYIIVKGRLGLIEVIND